MFAPQGEATLDHHFVDESSECLTVHSLPFGVSRFV